MRQTICKKIQNNTSESVIRKTNSQRKSQKLLLVKNYLEQKLETRGYRGHVKYVHSKELVQYKIKEGVIAVMKNNTLDIFEMPVKKFHGAMPLKFESVDIDSIKTQKATCCKRCHTWKQQANITRCSCGGYLIPRKRFHTESIESWDESFLEIQFAKADIRAALKTEKILSRRKKRYTPTGITPKLAGISSVQKTDNTQSEELLLIPSGEQLRVTQAKSVNSCSLIFCSAIAIHGKQTSDAEKLVLLKKYNLNHIEIDSENESFASDVRWLASKQAPQEAQVLVDSWSNPTRRQSKVCRKANYEKKWDHPESYSLSEKKDSPRKRDHTRDAYVPFFASSIPVPEYQSKVAS